MHLEEATEEEGVEAPLSSCGSHQRRELRAKRQGFRTAVRDLTTWTTLA
jgi:hypothetical protein